MVKEAEDNAEQDRAVRARIDARNALEAYTYSLSNRLMSDLQDMPHGDKEQLKQKLEDTTQWLDANQESAEQEEFELRRQDLEDFANPLLQSFYNNKGASSGSSSEDFEDEL
jgi:heat shock protein 5